MGSSPTLATWSAASIDAALLDSGSSAAEARTFHVTIAVYRQPVGLPDTWTFLTAWGYNSADAVKWMEYPGGDDGETGEKVSYDYHNQGSLDSVLSNFPQSYVYTTKYDEAGRVVERQFGSGYIQNQYSYYGWGAEGGRLEWIKTLDTSPSTTTHQHLDYLYDDGGNVTRIRDYVNGNPQTQTFTYDNLNRLTSALASGGSSGLGDYSQEYYTYSATTGNLASKAGLTYTYGDSDHAHAVTSVLVSAPDVTSDYEYDANGNMTERDVNGDTFYLAYDAENRMTGVTGDATAEFDYRCNGNVKGEKKTGGQEAEFE